MMTCKHYTAAYNKMENILKKTKNLYTEPSPETLMALVVKNHYYIHLSKLQEAKLTFKETAGL